MSPRVRTILTLLCVAGVAFLAAAAAFWTMRGGIGLTNDSRTYVALANGLTARAAGVTLKDDATLNRHFPPAFPATLAAVDSLLRVGPFRAARLMNVACLIASTALLARLVWRASRERWRALLAAILFAASADTFATHVHLWSEPTFNVWMLLTAGALARYLRGHGARRWLVAASLCATAAILTRYAAAALVLAGAIAVAARSPKLRRAGRLGDAALFALTPAAALLLWQLVGSASADLGQRTVGFVPIGWPKLDQCLQAFGTWIAWHASVPALARVAGVVAIAAVVLLLARPRRALTNPPLALAWTYVAVYPLFLLVSIQFVDDATPLDMRILAPMHAMAILVGCATLGGRTLTSGAVAVLLVIAQVASSASYLANVRYTGLGYASLRWQQSQTVAFVRGLPWQLPVFTTHHVALDFLAGRNVYSWPTLSRDAAADDEEEADAPSVDETRAAEAALDRAVMPMLENVRAAGGRGYFVEIRWPRQSKRFVTREELNRYLKLRLIAKYPDGRVFKIEGIVNDPGTATQPAE